MEVSVFTQPHVREVLDEFVEIRLHVDDYSSEETIARNQRFIDYRERLAQSSALPIYVIIDPNNPDRALRIFPQADVPGGNRFRQFLHNHLDTN